MKDLITFTTALILTVLTVLFIGYTLGGLLAVISSVTLAPIMLCYSLDFINNQLNKGL